MTLLPDFLVVGAAKSGTTSLFRILQQDPRVFIPEIKECRFFSQMPRNFRGGEAAKFQNEGPRDLDEYISLYDGKSEFIKGDISTDYFYYYEASIASIKHTYRQIGQEEPKIIILLRNPVDRVFSMYNHIIRLGSDTKDFANAFYLSHERIKQGYAWTFDLMGVGMSANAVEAFMSSFKRVGIYLYEDIFATGDMSAIARDLNLNPELLRPLKIRENANDYRRPKSLYVNAALSKLAHNSVSFLSPLKDSIVYELIKEGYHYLSRANRGAHKDILSIEQRNNLLKYYEKDTNRLEKLIGTSLNQWRL